MNSVLKYLIQLLASILIGFVLGFLSMLIFPAEIAGAIWLLCIIGGLVAWNPLALNMISLGMLANK